MNIVEAECGSQLDSHPVEADRAAHRVDNIEDELRPTSDIASVGVITSVGIRGKELHGQITATRMTLNTVKAGVN